MLLRPFADIFHSRGRTWSFIGHVESIIRSSNVHLQMLMVKNNRYWATWPSKLLSQSPRVKVTLNMNINYIFWSHLQFNIPDLHIKTLLARLTRFHNFKHNILPQKACWNTSAVVRLISTILTLCHKLENIFFFSFPCMPWNHFLEFIQIFLRTSSLRSLCFICYFLSSSSSSEKQDCR